MGISISRRVPVDLTDEEIRDFCDVFLDANVNHLSVDIGTRSSKPGTRGLMTKLCPGSYEIKIFATTIAETVQRSTVAGGNVTVPATLREGVLFVLAHELRHVWQSIRHSRNKAYWSGAYRRRPCEIDARQHVDKSEGLILSFCGVDGLCLTKRKRVSIDLVQEVEEIVEILTHAGVVTDDELRSELAQSGLNNDEAFSLARSMLDEMQTDAVAA